QELLGPHTIQLLDTYDSIQGARHAAELARPLWGVRLDSGNFDSLSRQVRTILDEAGLRDAKIMGSGDLDEDRIGELVAAGAPIDSFGVGTELATSGDAPSMGTIYKLVDIDGRPVAKWSEEKSSLPGAKQLFRFPDRDVLALADEPTPDGAEALLHRVILRGEWVGEPPPLESIRERAAGSLRSAGPRRVERSAGLAAMVDRMREEQK